MAMTANRPDVPFSLDVVGHCAIGFPVRMQSRWCRAWSRPNLTDFVHIFSKRGYLKWVFVHWRGLETKSKSTAYLVENWNSSTTVPDALFSPWWASTASSDRLCCSSSSCFRRTAALSACTLPAYPRLENHPFRRTRASDVGAALPCLRPGFPTLASRLSRRQIEASIDRGQSSRTHATDHAVESPSRLRWQPRIIVRYSRGPQLRRNTKWRRPRAADSTRASETRRSHPVEFYWSQTSSTANARAHRSNTFFSLHHSVARHDVSTGLPQPFSSKQQKKKMPTFLRGAWTDHCFPAPFSWFLHETGLECLKITSPRCFSLKCQRKDLDSRKVKEHRQFRGLLGRWRTAAIDRTTFHACQRCRKTAVFAVFPRLWGVIWRGKAFGDQQS